MASNTRGFEQLSDTAQGAPLAATLDWARALAAGTGGVSSPQPLERLAVLRGVAPRTLREHLRRLEQAGLLRRRPLGQRGLALCVDEQPAASGERRPDEGVTSAEAAATDEAGDTAGDATIERSVALLSGAGVYPQLARALARRHWMSPELIVAWLHELRQIRAVRRLAAVLVYTLESPERCLPPPVPADGESLLERAALPVERVGCAPSEELGTDRDADVGAVVGDAGAREEPVVMVRASLARAVPKAHERHGMQNAEALALWAAIHPVLAARLPAPVDELWLRPAHPVGHADGVLLVAVPTVLGADWLNLTGAPRAYEALREAMPYPPTLRFVPAGLSDRVA